MSSPLSIFRKYQYLLLVGFGIMLMFAFVIAPPLDNYLRSRANAISRKNPVVVTWKYGKIYEAELANMRTRHLLTMRFLESLVSRVVLTDAAPVELDGHTVYLKKGNSYPYLGSGTDPDGKPVYQLMVAGKPVDAPQAVCQPISPKASMIARASTERDLVRKMILAKKAEEVGIVITEEAVLDYLDRLCDTTPEHRPDYGLILAKSTNGRLDRNQLMAQMAMELAADRMLMLSQSGTFSLPPEELFGCFNQLNRRISAGLLPIEVAQFLGDTPEPTETAIKTLYKEAKDRFPNPNSPEPGFKLRKRIVFGYFRADYQKLLDAEIARIKPTIPDAEVDKYYQDRKETEFKRPELPSAEPNAEEKPPTDTGGSDAKKPAATPAAADSGMKGVPDAANPKPLAADAHKVPDKKTVPSKAPADKSTGSKTAQKTSASSAQPAPKTKPNPDSAGKTAPEPADKTKNADPAKAGAKKTKSAPGPDSEARNAMADGVLTLVNYQVLDNGAKKTAPPDASTGDVPPASDPKKAAAPVGTKKEVPAKTATGEDASGVPAKADTTSKPKIGAAQKDTPVATAPSAETKKPASKPPTYQPLDDKLRDEIRDRIARSRAEPAAREQLNKAIEKARVAVEHYARQIVRAQLLESVAAPAPLDIKKVAQENGLASGVTPLIDVTDVVDVQRKDPTDGDPEYYSLLRATETVSQQRGQLMRRTLAEVGFAGDLERYTPRRLVQGYVVPGLDIPPDAVYLYWRMEEKPERVPELKEVRDAVIAAWKLRAALPTAQQRAKSYVEKATAAGKPLSEVFPDLAGSIVQTDEFSWMTRGATPVGGGGTPVLSTVTGTVGGKRVTVELVGDSFMRDVFALKVGQVGAAFNNPKTVVYVVRVQKENMDEDQRKQLFVASRRLSPDVYSIAQMERGALLRAWYDDLEKKYEVKWNREPTGNWNR